MNFMSRLGCPLALLLYGCVQAGASEARTSVVAEFVGTSPCGAVPREFFGGISATTACHAISWRLTLLTNQSPVCKLTAAYGIPAPSNPNLRVEGPKVELEATWEIVKAAKSEDRTIYRINAGKPARSLWFASLGGNLLHLLAPDHSLMVGNGGWSYTLNNVQRAEKPGDNSQTVDQPSYKISPLATGPTVFGVFEGRSPCHGISRGLHLPVQAGCIKAKWRVTLYQNPETSAPMTYKVEGTLYRQGAREGTWSIVRGTKTDPNALVYRLAPAQTGPALLLLKGDDNVLFFLNQDGEPLVGHADFSYTLNRVTNK